MISVSDSGAPRTARLEAETLTPTLHPRRGGRRAVPTVLQMEKTECGAACLAMVLAHYGRWIPLEELRVRCGVSRDGTKAINIIDVARNSAWSPGAHMGPFQAPPRAPLPDDRVLELQPFRGARGVPWQPCLHQRPGRGAAHADQGRVRRELLRCLPPLPTCPEFVKGGRPASTLHGLFSRLGHARAPLFFVILATLVMIVPGLALPTLTKVFVDEVLIPRSER